MAVQDLRCVAMERYFPRCLFGESFEDVYSVIVLHKEHVYRVNQGFYPFHHVGMHLWKLRGNLLVISVIQLPDLTIVFANARYVRSTAKHT